MVMKIEIFGPWPATVLSLWDGSSGILREAGEEMLPGPSSSHLSAPGCSALPSPPGSAPGALALLDLLRAGPAAESAQDGILEGNPTAGRKTRTK